MSLDRQIPPLRLRQPGLRAGRGGREAERRINTGPRQRHPAAVPAGVGAAGPVPDRVLTQLVRDVLDLPQPEFLALVEVDRAGQRHGEERGGPGPAGAEIQVDRLAVVTPVEAERAVGPAVPGQVPVHVVVGQHPGGRRAGGGVERQRAVDHRAQLGGVPGTAQIGKVEHRVQLVPAQVAGQPRGIGQPDLADQYPAGVFVGDLAPGPVDIVHVVAVGIGRRARGLGQRRVLGQQRGGIDPDAVDAAIEPEPQDVLELLPHLRVGPVEVRLLGREQVQVPLPRRAVRGGRPGPRGAAEDRRPVVRREVTAGTAPGPEPEPFAFG